MYINIVFPMLPWYSTYDIEYPIWVAACKSCSSWSETFVLVLTLSLVSCLTSSVEKLLWKMMKEQAILIKYFIDDQKLA